MRRKSSFWCERKRSEGAGSGRKQDEVLHPPTCIHLHFWPMGQLEGFLQSSLEAREGIPMRRNAWKKRIMHPVGVLGVFSPLLCGCKEIPMYEKIFWNGFLYLEGPHVPLLWGFSSLCTTSSRQNSIGICTWRPAVLTSRHAGTIWGGLHWRPWTYQQTHAHVYFSLVFTRVFHYKVHHFDSYRML